MQPKILFLTLKVFSAMGGIEKVCRVAGKALHEISTEEGLRLDIYSIYDKSGKVEEKYFPSAVFRGFEGSKSRFVPEAVQKGRGADVVLLSHINLLSVGYAIKTLSPKTKLVLIAHGIEIWEPVPAWKRRMLRACGLILPISRFTYDKVRQLHGIPEEKLKIVNNCLDPFLPPPVVGPKSETLLERYGLTKEDKILFTLTRLSSGERYKGYDEVIMALKTLKKMDASIKYLIAGKWDKAEKLRLDRLIQQQGVEGEVVFTGYIADHELPDHFNLADIYVMPSRGEGFGIVFIEALYYGLPVIAGTKDGSVDAVAGGRLGLLVNPTNTTEILDAIKKVLVSPDEYQPDRTIILEQFGFPAYKKALSCAMNISMRERKKSTAVRKIEAVL